MGETSKRASARRADGWFDKYLVGKGIDIGCGDDPVTPDCVHWDLAQGDAQLMEGVADATFDWVYSSHCLEHVRDPKAALSQWWRILHPGGHLVISVPDEDLYEQGLWPPHLNTDHKTTWTLCKQETWSPVSHSLVADVMELPGAELLLAQRQDEGYDYSLQKAVCGHFVMPPDVAQQVSDERCLTAAMLGQPLRFLGFYPVDQSGWPQNANVSVEVVVRKVGHGQRANEG